jgi:hypothetical protein
LDRPSCWAPTHNGRRRFVCRPVKGAMESEAIAFARALRRGPAVLVLAPVRHMTAVGQLAGGAFQRHWRSSAETGVARRVPPTSADARGRGLVGYARAQAIRAPPRASCEAAPWVAAERVAGPRRGQHSGAPLGIVLQPAAGVLNLLLPLRLWVSGADCMRWGKPSRYRHLPQVPAKLLHAMVVYRMKGTPSLRHFTRFFLTVFRSIHCSAHPDARP